MTDWNGDLFDGVEISFAKSTWMVEEILHTRTMDQFRPYEEKTIMRCRQVSPVSGKQAIIKAHVQIPDGSGKPPDGTTINITVETEVKFMERLRERNCSSTPRLLDHAHMRQPEGMCLPGGYIVFVLMELLPGEMIMDFWSYSREKRDRIREAFKKAWLEVNDACVYHGDPGLRNLLWDEEKGKCYILDFEDADFIDKPHRGWCNTEFVFWELLKVKTGEIYEW